MKTIFGSFHTGVFGKSGGAMFVPSNAYNSVMWGPLKCAYEVIQTRKFSKYILLNS